jgi:ribosomal protein L11 methyltransferase
MTLAIDTQNLHPTTELSLEALQWLQVREGFANILDIGCGNGILSVVAAHAWETKVLAVDISPNAVADTEKTIGEYGLEEQVTVLRSDGFSHPEMHARAPYDLIICNLLADILVRIAPEVKKSLRPGGYAVLSGSLAWMSENVEKGYSSLGFEIVKKIEKSPWCAYIMRYNVI